MRIIASVSSIVSVVALGSPDQERVAAPRLPYCQVLEQFLGSPPAEDAYRRDMDKPAGRLLRARRDRKRGARRPTAVALSLRSSRSSHPDRD